MDFVAKTSETNIPDILGPTVDAFVLLLEKNREEIEKIPRRTFRYGEKDRNQLDVYYPIDTSLSSAPVLFFIYGGGFTTGDRIWAEPHSLGYASLGAFFAQRGFITVIPDYRLVPNVRYPEPAEDIRDAFLWVVMDYPTMKIPGSPAPDVHNIYAMAHSAGATHLTTVLFDAEVLSEPIRSQLIPRIQGIVLNGGAYHFRQPLADPEALSHYYGEPREMTKKEPLGLLEAADGDLISRLPEILLVQAEKEPKEIKIVGEDMRKVLQKRLEECGGGRGGWKEVKLTENKGHNHISSNWALGSGEGEEWGEVVTSSSRPQNPYGRLHRYPIYSFQRGRGVSEASEGSDDESWEETPWTTTSMLHLLSYRFGTLDRPRPAELKRWQRPAQVWIPDTRGKAPRGRNVGKLANIMSIPMDVFFEITSKLCPVDILQLGRASKRFRSTFMSRSSKHVWVAARRNVPGLPDCPPDLDEPQYANLLFEHNCLACGKSRANMVDYALRVRFCKPCFTENVPRGPTLLRPFGKKTDPIVFTLLPRSSIKHAPRISPADIASDSNDITNAYYRPEFNKVVRKYLAYEDDDDRCDRYVKERQELASQIMKSGEDLIKWAKTFRISKRGEARQRAENRKASITTKLKILGWDESSFPESWESYTWNKLVDQPRELTPRKTVVLQQVWDKIHRQLEHVLMATQQRREEEAYRLRLIKRGEEFRTVYAEFVANTNQSDRLVLPSFPDARGLHTVEWLLQEDRANIPMTQERWAANLEWFMVEAEAHKQRVKRDLVQILKRAKTDHHTLRTPFAIPAIEEDPDEKILFEASAFFTCIGGYYGCQKPRRYPEILGHLHLQEGRWSPHFVEAADVAEVTEYVLKTLGLKDDITSADLGALDGRFFCLCGAPRLQPMNFVNLIQHIVEELKWLYREGYFNPETGMNNEHDLKSSTPFVVLLPLEHPSRDKDEVDAVAALLFA
ncbi:hypothetical protein JAAARDRAFT_78398 [Jaapia argillacea MUCL 33604]|uniref:F-box domain-containing protein n=1 Tax=Jaapia argillacea MUCL 33604 TaxID=933084 RepID=A0A067Q310_9AGAM|nr:hypothetical protein JAAARDRAFT_78398 [Jaapia argillacea MUCL 33604]